MGIGVLAQPQMAVRFMTVKSRRELNRAVGVGGFFILMLPGVAYTVGTLSNVYFYHHEELRGKVVSVDPEKTLVKFLPEGTSDQMEPLSIPLGQGQRG